MMILGTFYQTTIVAQPYPAITNDPKTYPPQCADGLNNDEGNKCDGPTDIDEANHTPCEISTCLFSSGGTSGCDTFISNDEVLCSLVFPND